MKSPYKSQILLFLLYWKKYFYQILCISFAKEKNDRIKGLVRKKDGFLLLYKRFENKSFQYPRNEKEVKELTPKQFHWLMEGLSITSKRKIEEILPAYLA